MAEVVGAEVRIPTLKAPRTPARVASAVAEVAGRAPRFYLLPMEAPMADEAVRLMAPALANTPAAAAAVPAWEALSSCATA